MAPAAEFGEMRICDAGFLKRFGKIVLVELRISSRTGKPSHVRQCANFVRVEERKEVLDASS
jgi:hypothetical protein